MQNRMLVGKIPVSRNLGNVMSVAKRGDKWRKLLRQRKLLFTRDVKVTCFKSVFARTIIGNNLRGHAR